MIKKTEFLLVLLLLSTYKLVSTDRNNLYPKQREMGWVWVCVWVYKCVCVSFLWGKKNKQQNNPTKKSPSTFG